MKATEWIKDNPKIKPKALLNYHKFTFDCVAIGREMLDLPPLLKHGLLADNAESIENG